MTTALVTLNDYNAFTSNVNYLCNFSKYHSMFKNAGYKEEAAGSLIHIKDTIESMLWDLDNIRFWKTMEELE